MVNFYEKTLGKPAGYLYTVRFPKCLYRPFWKTDKIDIGCSIKCENWLPNSLFKNFVFLKRGLWTCRELNKWCSREGNAHFKKTGRIFGFLPTERNDISKIILTVKKPVSVFVQLVFKTVIIQSHFEKVSRNIPQSNDGTARFVNCSFKN